MQVVNACIREEPAQGVFKFAALHRLRPDHHRVRIVGAHREQAVAEHARNFTGRGRRRARALAHEDRAGAAIGRGDLVVGIRQHNDGLARLCVGEADPAWNPGVRVHHHAARAQSIQLRVAQEEERCEGFVRQRDELEGIAHDAPSQPGGVCGTAGLAAAPGVRVRRARPVCKVGSPAPGGPAFSRTGQDTKASRGVPLMGNNFSVGMLGSCLMKIRPADRPRASRPGVFHPDGRAAPVFPPHSPGPRSPSPLFRAPARRGVCAGRGS